MRARVFRWVGVATAVAAIVPAAAVGKPSKAELKAAVREAKRECQLERGSTDATRAAFRAKYGSLGLGHCVKVRTRDALREAAQARRQALKDCKAERAQDPAAFAEKYGTNSNRRNALGRCVSQKMQVTAAKQDRADREEIEAEHNAAAACRAERSQDPQAFAEKYGTNRNKRNAFGKCVSQRARADQESEQPEPNGDAHGGQPNEHPNGGSGQGAPGSGAGEGSSSPGTV